MGCMDNFVTARNSETGKIGSYPRRFVEHPVLGRFLEEVPSGAKPRIPLQVMVDAFESHREQAESEEVIAYISEEEED